MNYIRIILIACFFLLTACEPVSPPQPSPVAVIISPEVTFTPISLATNTPAPTATPFPCEVDSGRVLEFNENRSPTANENLRYRVYIPPCYQEAQVRYPVAFLLHGLSYREQQWEDLGAVETLDRGIRIGALPPMILVMPYYGEIGQVNSFPPNASYETVIMEELLPAIDSDFCTISNRDHRAIGGISRGGFWAYSLAFRYPDVFGIVGGHSAFFPDVGDVPAAFNPVEIARTSALLLEANLRMYLDNGAGDSAASSQQRLSDQLELRSIPHSYIINAVGEHNNEYWSTHVSEYLAFYGRGWSRNYAELPTCLAPSP